MSSQYAIFSEAKTFKRKAITRPVPASVGDDEVLIKNVAVASNPKDWKGAKFVPDFPGLVEGNDVAGIIVKVGKAVSDFKVDERVAAFTRMRSSDDSGAYQEYSVAPANTTFRVANGVSFEDAATLPLAIMTAALGLYTILRLPLPSHPIKTSDQWIAINGASSSVGSFATQLAKLSGLRILGVAGGSGDYAKDCGVDELIDYRKYNKEGELMKQLRTAFRVKKIVKVFDAISSDRTQQTLAEALSSTGGEIVTVLGSKKFDNIPNVAITTVFVRNAYSDTQTGDLRESAFAQEQYRQYGKWLGEGILKPNKTFILPKGLDSVDKGLTLLEQEKVSGKKLVYRIEDTTSLIK